MCSWKRSGPEKTDSNPDSPSPPTPVNGQCAPTPPLPPLSVCGDRVSALFPSDRDPMVQQIAFAHHPPRAVATAHAESGLVRPRSPLPVLQKRLRWCGNALSARTTLHRTRSFQLLEKHRNHLVPVAALEPPGGDAYRVWLIPAVSEGEYPTRIVCAFAEALTRCPSASARSINQRPSRNSSSPAGVRGNECAFRSSNPPRVHPPAP